MHCDLQIQYVQTSLYGVGRAAYRCFYGGGSSPEPSNSDFSNPQTRHSDAERLFPRSSHHIGRSDEPEVDVDESSSDLPRDGMGSLWSYLGGGRWAGPKLDNSEGDSSTSEESESMSSSQKTDKGSRSQASDVGEVSGRSSMYREAHHNEKGSHRTMEGRSD